MAKNKDIEMQDEMLDEGTEPRVYELGFHLDPELPSDEVKKAFQAVREMIADKGEIVAEGAPQKISLAYTISRQETSGRRDFDTAHFAWIVYETTPEAHKEIVSAAGENKKMIRFIDILTTKEAGRQAAEMQEMALKMPEPGEEAEAQVAELDAALESATV